MKELSAYMLTAVNAAISGGRAIMEIYGKDDSAFDVETKGDNSPLTAADRAAHTCIISFLEQTGISVLSEEGRDIPYDERCGWKQLWIVDPLDGTKEFIKRNGEFTVNIALVEKGCPVIGVVYAPVLRTLYFGSEGTGSYKTVVESADVCFKSFEDLISVSEKLPVQTRRDIYTIVASKSHRNPETDEFIAQKEKLHGKTDVASRGSSLKICLVAEGAADIYPRLGPTMEWDTAAGHAVALFAGARVYRYADGGPLGYNKPDLLNPFFIVERE